MCGFWKELYFLQFLALCACTILVAYLLTELIGLSTRVSEKCSGFVRPVYGYGLTNGPHTWKDMFPASRGRKQSPVNIITQEVVLVDSACALLWTNYTCAPCSMNLLNNGGTVVVQGSWPERVPAIQGGPLGTSYSFQAAMFRWGVSDAEGSEHTINYMAFPLELQACHAQCGSKPLPAPAPAFVTVSFLFEISELDNPYLDHVVMALPQVSCPGTMTELMPFPLAWLCPPFATGYFSYDGSLTFPPCSENVRWIVHPTAIGISTRQVAAFRQLMGWEGPLHNNLRPVQPLNCRDVFYYSEPRKAQQESETKPSTSSCVPRCDCDCAPAAGPSASSSSSCNGFRIEFQ